MNTITAGDVHDLVQVEAPRVAPGGDRVAYIRKTPDGGDDYTATIHIVPTGGDAGHRFTLADGRDSEPRFSPSGDRLAFVSTRGDDQDPPQLWVMPTDGGEARQVTAVAGGVSDIAWRPDGNAIAFRQQVDDDMREADADLDAEDFDPEPPDPRVIDRTVYRSMEEYFDGRRHHVYTVSLAEDGDSSADDVVRRVTTDEADHHALDWGDADTLYYTTQVGDPDPDDTLDYEIRAHDLDSESVETVHRTTGWGQHLAATSDGRIAHIEVEAEQASLQQSELAVVDAETGDVTHLTADLDRTLAYESAPQWGPEERHCYFRTPDEGAITLWRTPGDGTTPVRVLRDEGASIDAVHVGDSVIATVISEWDHPGDISIASHGGQERHRLTRVNADFLDDRAVAQPEAVQFPRGEAVSQAVSDDPTREAVDQEIQGWLLRPPEFDPDESYPLLVNVHGGPHLMWTTSGTMWHEFQTLAARGYVVFWSNPRGSSGYGERFMQAIERDWGAVTASDILAGIEAVTDRAPIDDAEVFLTGGSFGGFMTSWLVGQTDRFRAAVTQRGVHDLTGFYGSTDGAYKLVEGDFDTTPWAEPDFLWEQSPSAHADEVSTPTLVLHSDDDYRTPACTAELFYRILRKHDVDTRLVRYPDEGHELSRSGQPDHIVDRIERILRWFDGYASGTDVPPALERADGAGLTGNAEDEDGRGDEANE